MQKIQTSFDRDAADYDSRKATTASNLQIPDSSRSGNSLSKILKCIQRREKIRNSNLNLTSNQILDLYQVFDLIDRDNNGTANQEDLLRFMRSFGQNISEAEFQDIFAEIDSDGDNVLDFDEFCNLVTTKIRVADIRNELVDIFCALDIRDCGTFKTADLVQNFTNINDPFTEEDAEKLFQIMGIDPYGNMNAKTFLKLFEITEYENSEEIINFNHLLEIISLNHQNNEKNTREENIDEISPSDINDRESSEDSKSTNFEEFGEEEAEFVKSETNSEPVIENIDEICDRESSLELTDEDEIEKYLNPNDITNE